MPSWVCWTLQRRTHLQVAFLTWKRSVCSRCLLFHGWKEVDSRSSKKKCVDFCGQKSWECYFRHLSREHFRDVVSQNWLNASSSWVSREVFLKTYFCAIDIICLLTGFFFGPCTTKCIFDLLLGKQRTVQSMSPQLVRRPLYNFWNNDILFLRVLSTKR